MRVNMKIMSDLLQNWLRKHRNIINVLHKNKLEYLVSVCSHIKQL